MKHANTKPDAFRFRGSLYGLIFGDIIGSYFEFSQPHPRRYPDPNALKHGENIFKVRFGYTDDTILTLHSIEAFIEGRGQFRPLLHIIAWNQYAQGHSQWSPTGTCFDLGISTRKSLEQIDWLEKASPSRSGNGVLMKLLPFAWATACKNQDESMWSDHDAFFDKVTSMTHGSEETIKCTRAMASALTKLLHGEPWSSAREPLTALFPVKGSIDSGRGYSGYCVDSLELAFHLMDECYDWQSAISQILSLGGDTDTNAAIFGQLFGAAYPNEMHELYFPHKADIHLSDRIDMVCNEFLKVFDMHEEWGGMRIPMRRHKSSDEDLRQEDLSYALECPRDCVHHAEGCLLGYPVGSLQYFRRMNSPYREKIRMVRSDAFRTLWKSRLERCPPDGAPPCYHSDAQSTECRGTRCAYKGNKKGP